MNTKFIHIISLVLISINALFLKYKTLIFVLFLSITSSAIMSQQKNLHDKTLWYKQPAKFFEESLA